MERIYKVIDYHKNIEKVESYDVVVCGGGPAGWIAAVSSARCGRKTALIERYGFLGGTATAGLVIPLSGYYHKGERVVGGIAWEFVKKLEKIGAAQIELPKGHISFHPEYYKLIAQQMAVESGVDIFTNTSLIDCIKENDSISYILIHNKSGVSAIKGKCFIDATGDADLCHFAGVPMLETPNNELQPISLCFALENVDTNTELLRACIRHNGKNGKPSSNSVISKCLQKYKNELNDFQFGGPWFNTLNKGNCLAVNMTRIGVDATDSKAYTKAEYKLRQDMFTFVNILKKEFEEFKNCEIVYSAVNAGIRETRHIKGVYTMTLDDVINHKPPLCPVARCAHPMDIHIANSSNQSLTQISKNVYVPYETMICEKIDNLIVAGRCISATKEPYASLRVMGTLMCIGESAGIAANLSVETNSAVQNIPRKSLNEQIEMREIFYRTE